MKKRMIVGMFLLVCIPKLLFAGVKSDIAIGVILALNGTAFEVFSQNSAKEAGRYDRMYRGELKLSDGHKSVSDYFENEADTEYEKFGYSERYIELYSYHRQYEDMAISNLAEANRLLGQRNSADEKKTVYKTVSITSFCIGGAMILKGTITYFVKRQKEKEFIQERVNIRPYQNGVIASCSILRW